MVVGAGSGKRGLVHAGLKPGCEVLMLALLARFVSDEVWPLVGLGVGVDVHADWPSENINTAKAARIFLMAEALQKESRTYRQAYTPCVRLMQNFLYRPDDAGWSWFEPRPRRMSRREPG